MEIKVCVRGDDGKCERCGKTMEKNALRNCFADDNELQEYIDNAIISKPCECKGPGFCKRHGISKSFYEWKKCQDDDSFRKRLDVAAQVEEIKNDYGPGTEMHHMFSKLGFDPPPDCDCRNVSRIMNRMGGKWCLENMDLLTKKIQENARKHGKMAAALSSWSGGVKLLIRKAVENAEKKKNST